MQLQLKRHRQRSARRGYTLLEMLLTLGVVVLMAGMSWPALRGTMASHQLREAGEQVRIELAKTRLEAMHSARPLEFRYCPGSPWYQVITESDDDESTPDSAVDAQARSAASGRDASKSGVITERLPGHVQFVDTTLVGATATVPATEDEASTEPPADDDSRWSAPIRFEADGTTESARLVLSNADGRHVVLTLRGLTGTVAVGSLVGDEVLQR